MPLVKAVGGNATDDVEMDVVSIADLVRRTLSVSGRPLFDDNSKPSGGIAVFRDITADRAASEAMRRSDMRVKEAIDALESGFALFDAADRLVLWNDRLIGAALRAKIGNPTGLAFDASRRASGGVASIVEPGGSAAGVDVA